MTRNEIQERLFAIFECSGDDEAAHGLEDKLHHDVLRAIATGELNMSPEAAAELALTSLDIEFARWMA